MTKIENFKVSTYLKNVIGRELVTNKFVAIFELVKNSIDANASLIEIELNTKKNSLYIVDNGWGMTTKDIIEKWLFVAYSAKTDGVESAKRTNYLDLIHEQKNFAGNKGVGRFSCDTLGKKINLYSRSDFDESDITCLHVDWTKFDENSKKEFSDIKVRIDEKTNFPDLKEAHLPQKSGTVIEILDLRDNWDQNEVKNLRQYLAKLIDPFGSSQFEVEIHTHFISTEHLFDPYGGKIENNLTEILENRTSHIHVEFENNSIRTNLSDRGIPIFKISEEIETILPSDCIISADVYYLNKSAKELFRKNMGIRSVNFGSIFLFLNGFRIFPIGEELDDTFGLNHRKQQGHSRFLGTRDVLGRIDVSAPTGVFREVSSRDSGLIEDANSKELYEFIKQKIVLPLEKYVVGVNWSRELPEEFKYGEEFTGFEYDEAKVRILEIIGGYAKNKNIKLLDYNKNIIDIMDKQKNEIDKTLNDLLLDAQLSNDKSLAKRISQTKSRIKELEKSEKSVQLLERKVEEQKVEYAKKVGALEKQAKFLETGQNLSGQRVLFLLHHVAQHAIPIELGAHLGLELISKTIDTLNNPPKKLNENFNEILSESCNDLKKIRKYFSTIQLEVKRIKSIVEFSEIIKFDVENPKMVDDVLKFLDEYFAETKSDSINPQVHFESDNTEFICEFSLIDMAVVIDNFIANSHKADAQNIWFEAKNNRAQGILEIQVRDDGKGIDTREIDPYQIFEKHYSGTGGTGLGLYQIKQIVSDWGGTIELSPSENQIRADFKIILKENKK